MNTLTDTQKLVGTFLESCQTKGLSNNTIRVYTGYLTRFAQENPQLPTNPLQIETWLITKGESFTNRGNTLRRLQTFYKYLAQTNILTANPIPQGQTGRHKNHITPTKKKKQPTAPTTAKVVNLPQTETASLVNDYLTSCKARGLSPRTLESYRKQLDNFASLYPTLTYNLADIEKVWANYNSTHDEWKHQLFRTIRTFYYWLADYKGLPTLLRFRRITPKRSKKQPDNLSDEQAVQFLALLPTMPPQDKAIIELLIEAGPRVGELCSIVKENIQMQYAKVIIDHQEKTAPAPYIIVKGKTGERKIEISLHVHNTLRDLIPGDTGPIFWGRTKGLPLSTDAVYRIVSKYLAQIGIVSGKRGPHMLRHTMGRLYIASEKGDLESLRQQMGHTNITTTAIYTQLSARQVHKKFDAANPRERIMGIITTNEHTNHQSTMPEHTATEDSFNNKGDGI